MIGLASRIHRIISRRSLVQCLCVAALVAVLLPGVSTAQEKEADTVSVMTFNIRYGSANDGDNHWNKRHDLVFDVIGKYDCDVVGLQEALRFQIDAIRQALPEYGEVGVGRDDGKTKGEYSAILYRTDRLKLTDSGTFWLSDTPEVVASTSWGNRITRICTWARFVQKDSGKAFYHFNLHMDHQSQPSREKSAVLIDQRIAQREHADPLILTGDFNAGEANPAITYLKGASETGEKPSVRLVDTFRVLHPEATEVGTFNRFEGVRSGEKIDYIFALPETKVLEAKIIFDTPEGRCPSDHFPVIARIGL